MRLLGPVFQKELLELSRRRTTYYLRALTGGALLVVVLLYASHGSRSPYLSTVKQQAALGSAIFQNWMWVQFWVVCGVMPLIVGGLVAAEREAGSLDLLFTTHLTDREIVLGKLASRLTMVALLVFSALPVLVILGLLGGIDLDRLLKLYAITASAALLAAAVAMWRSVRAKRPWIAVLQTYLMFAFFWGAAPIMLMSLIGVLGPVRFPDYLTLFCGIAPYLPVHVLTHGGPPPAVLFMGWGLLAKLIATWLALAAAFLVDTTRGLRRRPSRFTRLADAVAGWLRPISAGLGRVMRATVVGRPRGRLGAFDLDGALFRLQLVAWPVSALLVPSFTLLGQTGWFGFTILVALQTAFLHLIAATAGASLLARERQRGSLDVLLLTRLSSASILGVVFVRVLRACTPTFLLVATTVAAGPWLYLYPPLFATWSIAILTAYSVVVAAIAVLISAGAPRPGQAIAATMVLTLVHWLLPLPVGTAWSLPGAVTTRHVERGLLIYIAVFTTILVVGTVSGLRLLRSGRPFPAAVVAATVIPLWLLLVAPGLQDEHEPTLLLRWIPQRNGEFSWENGLATMPVAAAAYWTAAAVIIGFTLLNADRLLGRLQARKPKKQAAVAAVRLQLQEAHS